MRRLKDYKIGIGFTFVLTAVAAIFLLSSFVKNRFVKNEETEFEIVAKVGDKLITAEELKLNYEFGFPHLKTGKTSSERLKNYLDFLINEKLLASEGEKLGISLDENIKKQEEKLFDELSIQALINQEVKSKITVSENEIRNALNKSKVSFKLRFWADDRKEEIFLTHKEMKQKGFAEVLGKILQSNSETNIDPKNFETDYLTWLEISPEVLNAIKDLPVGDISNPKLINNVYYLFQILDIRRSTFTENDYKSKASSLENILFHQKLQKELVSYVSNIMEPVNLTTKGKQFRVFADAIAKWKKSEELKKMSFEDAYQKLQKDIAEFAKLKKMENDVLIKFKGGSYDLKTFIQMFDFTKVKEKPENRNRFRSAVNDRIAITMRDYFLAKKAEEKNLGKLPEVQEELSSWREKWTYRELVNRYLADDKEKFGFQAIEFQKDPVKVINGKIDSLKTLYPVEVYHSVLDTIKVNDFKKSRWASLQLYKAGSGRQAIPVVDPVWKK